MQNSEPNPRSAEPPPQPSQVLKWVMVFLIGGVEASVTWMILIARFEGPPLSRWAVWAAFTTITAWGLLHILATFRFRLDENGVWPNRRNHARFIPWEGASLGARGHILLLRNGSDSTEINTAVFAKRRAFLDFLARKFPPPTGYEDH